MAAQQRRAWVRARPGRPAGRRRSRRRRILRAAGRTRAARSGRRLLRPARGSRPPRSATRRSRSAGSRASSPSVGWSETTAVSISCTVEQGEPRRQLVILRGCTPTPPRTTCRTSPSRMGGSVRCASASLKARGQRCWWTSRPAIVRSRSSRSESPRRAARGRGARRLPRGRGRSAERCRGAGPCRPRAATPRRSHAWAASISSIEATRAPSPTISSSRLAASGAIVIRSSIPSACVVETSSNETGCASSRASTAIAWIAMPYSLSALSASAGRAPRPSVEPGQGALEQLHRPLGRRRDDGREREPGDVERGRERLHLEVADRDHPVLLDDDERVRLRRVELDRELGCRRTRTRRARHRSAGRSSGT